MLIEIFCGKFDDIIQHMGIEIYDWDLMYDQTEEALFKLSFHQDVIIETICQDIQEKFQHTKVSPFAKKQIDKHLNVESYDFSFEFEENLQQSCQMLSYLEKEQERQTNF